jgi:DNA-binding MarR family transcriptional regulator
MHPHFARFGISGAQWGVLRMLHRASSEGQPALRLTDLSNRLLIRPPTGTAVVDRLEQMGLLQREASATDLRSKIVCLTPRGRELVERVLLVHSKQICAVLSGLNLQEQTELQELLGRLCRHLDCMLANGAPPCVE